MWQKDGMVDELNQVLEELVGFYQVQQVKKLWPESDQLKSAKLQAGN